MALLPLAIGVGSTATTTLAAATLGDVVVAIAVPCNTLLLCVLAYYSRSHGHKLEVVQQTATSSAQAAASAATVAADAARITRELGGLVREGGSISATEATPPPPRAPGGGS